MKTIKEWVCPECWGDPHANDCICGYTKVTPILKEFQICECCDRRYDDPISEENQYPWIVVYSRYRGFNDTELKYLLELATHLQAPYNTVSIVGERIITLDQLTTEQQLHMLKSRYYDKND